MAGARQGADARLSKVFGLSQLIGLLGGSFNPAHGGHRRISLFARAALGLDEVWWLVSPGNPLKPQQGMAPLPARFASAQAQARRAPIRATAIEREFGTRFTLDTLARLKHRYPAKRFVWIMGADNLAQFHRWHRWRDLARAMPIAVIARPGYDAAAMTAPAMAYLRRYRRFSRDFSHAPAPTPALILLRFDPDPRSATSLRETHPDWAKTMPTKALRDGVTHRPIR